MKKYRIEWGRSRYKGHFSSILSLSQETEINEKNIRDFHNYTCNEIIKLLIERGAKIRVDSFGFGNVLSQNGIFYYRKTPHNTGNIFIPSLSEA